MANDFSHRGVSSGIRVFLHFVCLASCLQRAEVRADWPIDDSIGDFRPVNFDGGNGWIFPRSEESPSADDSTEETLDDEVFDRLLRRSGEDRDESRRRFFTGKRIEDDDSSTILKEKSVALPARFVYVAREFYRSWVIPSLARNSGGKMEENNDDSSGGNFAAENGKPIEGAKPGLGSRTIIDAPTSGCPAGERRDMHGRCRMIYW